MKVTMTVLLILLVLTPLSSGVTDVTTPVLPDLGNCPQIKGIFVVFRDQGCLVRDFFFKF